MESVQAIKQRFGIIGDDPKLNRAVEKAIQVAPTDISVLVTGESGVGKESIPKIVHALSHRKHGKYIAVNCGAIPEGTIDSELFGHEKGAFTGATQTRNGYFEVADGGTIFLDEVGELPLPTQVRLLRVLENGDSKQVQDDNESLIQKIYGNSGDDIDEADIDEDELNVLQIPQQNSSVSRQEEKDKYYFAEEIEEEETISLQDKELELIKKSLERHSGKRKAAAEELGISERTLYRKIKQYNL